MSSSVLYVRLLRANTETANIPHWLDCNYKCSAKSLMATSKHIYLITQSPAVVSYFHVFNTCLTVFLINFSQDAPSGMESVYRVVDSSIYVVNIGEESLVDVEVDKLHDENTNELSANGCIHKLHILNFFLHRHSISSWNCLCFRLVFPSILYMYNTFSLVSLLSYMLIHIPT